MTTQLSLPFQRTSNAFANYNASDIAAGTGNEVFYGIKTSDNSVLSYSLISETMYSDTKITQNNLGGGTTGTALDIDFDVLFNMPRSIKGKVKANIPFMLGTGGVNNGGTAYAIMKVRKWDGTTETEIASNTSSRSFSGGGLNVSDGTVVYVEANIANATQFKSGEYLRITIQIVVTSAGANGCTCTLYHDPANRTAVPSDFGLSITTFNAPNITQLIIGVPFVIYT